MEHPLGKVVNLWLEKIDTAVKVKRDRFQQYADEAMRFFDSSHNFMWDAEYATAQGGFLDKDSWGAGGTPSFRMTVNRVFEAVALFGPTLFARYPQVKVSTTTTPDVTPEALGLNMQDPNAVMQYQQLMMQQQMDESHKHSCASVKEHYLNWLQIETNKKDQCRMAITEAIVKGMGCLYTGISSPKGTKIRFPRSEYLNVDDYVKDPDATYRDDVEWIAVRRLSPVNRVEERYGLQPGTLKGHIQSFGAQNTFRGKKDAKQNRHPSESQSYDLLEYWEIFSKNGFGDKLRSTGMKSVDSNLDLSFFGDYCHIVVADGVPFPLNIPSQAIKTEEPDSLFQRAQWPIPFWTDENLAGGWPVTELFFYDKPGSVWPISLIKPAIGELRFVNWCMSFMADRVAASSTTYVGLVKAAGAEIQNQLKSGMSPFTVVEISDIMGKSINDVVSFLQAPSFNLDVWKMVADVMEMIDKRTGLTELLYGVAGKQIRSAREADIRDANISIRPDDMAEKTEDWLSRSCIKEMEAAAWALSPEDVVPAVGQAGAQVFQHIQTQGFETLVRDYKYRIEAGSARKPNKANRIKSLQDFGQVAMPVIQQYAMQGMVEPWNAYAKEYAKALDMDASQFLVNIPQPSPEQQQAQQAQQQQQMMEQQVKLQMDMAKLENLVQRLEVQRQKMEHAEENQEIASEKMDQTDERIDIEEAKLQLEEERHEMDMLLKESQFYGRNQSDAT